MGVFVKKKKKFMILNYNIWLLCYEIHYTNSILEKRDAQRMKYFLCEIRLTKCLVSILHVTPSHEQQPFYKRKDKDTSDLLNENSHFSCSKTELWCGR